MATATDDARGSAMPALTGLILAAGLASRCGGRIKGLTPVGENGETMLELNILQGKSCGITDLCVVVGPATVEPIRALLGDAFHGLPVRYAFQRPPDWRVKPLGTVDAVLVAREQLHCAFVVLSGVRPLMHDTIYGVDPMRMVCQYLQQHAAEATAVCAAYRLQVCLPENGSRVNRARIERDAAGWLLSMQEQYDICSGDVGPDRRYTGDELTSLNIFGFRPSHLAIFAAQYDAWLQALLAEPAGPPPPGKKDRTSREFILADVVNTMAAAGHATAVLGPTDATPLELTSMEDVPLIQAAIRAQGQGL